MMPLTNFQDQMGNRINLQDIPERIISLVPSHTSLLYDLGLDEKIVGITKFCPRSSGKYKASIIGGTKQFNFKVIHELSPDLIIGNKEENYLQGINELSVHYPLWMSDILSYHDGNAMVLEMGKIFHVEDLARRIVNEIELQIATLSFRQIKTALYFIWKDPFMVAGGDTYINEMMKLCGFNNLMEQVARYPEINEIKIAELNPELIMLSSEPYPFRKKHVKIFQNIAPDARILLVDGAPFSWHGSFLLKAIPYLKTLLKKTN